MTMSTEPTFDLADVLRLVDSMVPWHKRTAQRLGGSFTTVLALDTAEEDGLNPVSLRRVGRLVAENLCGLDADEILACRAALGPLAREVVRLRADLAEVEAERDAASAELTWHEQMNGTRAEQEAFDAEAAAVDAAADALTPEQIRAELIEVGLDPDRVEREAEVSARLIVRWMQARDERDAARGIAPDDERRHTLLLHLTPSLLDRVQALGYAPGETPEGVLPWLVGALEEARSEAEQIAMCVACGPCDHSDEDGCCLTCGRDMIIVADAHSADMVREHWREAEDVERERDDLRLTLAAEQGRPEGAPYNNPEMVLAMSNGERIRRGLSWRELAAILDVSPSTLTRWTHGKMLSVPAYLRVCKWLSAAISETTDIARAGGPGWCDRCSPDRCDCEDGAAMIAADKATT